MEITNYSITKLTRLNISQLWSKTRNTFKLAYEKFFDQVDWFLKTDDDTYVNVDNLRRFLAKKDTNSPMFYGKFFSPFVKGITFWFLTNHITQIQKLFRNLKLSRNNQNILK